MSRTGETIIHTERKKDECEISKKYSAYSFLSNKEKRKPTKVGQLNQSKNIRNSITKSNAIVKISSSLIKKNKHIEELENKIEKLTKEISQLQVQKLKLNNKLLEINTHSSQTISGFDTGSNFPQISKIVEKWTYFAKKDISDNYIDFEDSPNIIYHLIQDLFIVVRHIINQEEQNFYIQIANILHLNYEDNKVFLQIKESLNLLFKENLEAIFGQPSFHEKVIKEYTTVYNNNICKLNDKKNNLFQDMINDSSFVNMINNIKEILLFFQFYPQKIELHLQDDFNKRKLEIFNIKNNEDKKHYFEIFDYNSNIDNILILLKPPLIKNKYLFNKDFKIIAMPYNLDISNDNNITEFNDFHDTIDIDKQNQINVSKTFIGNIENNNNINISKSNDINKDRCVTEIIEVKTKKNKNEDENIYNTTNENKQKKVIKPVKSNEILKFNDEFKVQPKNLDFTKLRVITQSKSKSKSKSRTTTPKFGVQRNLNYQINCIKNKPQLPKYKSKKILKIELSSASKDEENKKKNLNDYKRNVHNLKINVKDNNNSDNSGICDENRNSHISNKSDLDHKTLSKSSIKNKSVSKSKDKKRKIAKHCLKSIRNINVSNSVNIVSLVNKSDKDIYKNDKEKDKDKKGTLFVRLQATRDPSQNKRKNNQITIDLCSRDSYTSNKNNPTFLTDETCSNSGNHPEINLINNSISNSNAIKIENNSKDVPVFQFKVNK